MSINRVKNIPGVTATQATDRLTNPSAKAADPSVASQPAQVDGFTQSPLPARFPWMNRLTRQLEPTATQRAAFPAAPALGDHLDQSA